jgi:hypothetical protein
MPSSLSHPVLTPTAGLILIHRVWNLIYGCILYARTKIYMHMKTFHKLLISGLMISTILLLAFTSRRSDTPLKKKIPFVPPKGCVFRTVMGEESSDSSFIYKTPEKVLRSVDRGLMWVMKAQKQERRLGCRQSQSSGRYGPACRANGSGNHSNGGDGVIKKW